MGVSCGCAAYDDCEWWYESASDFAPLTTKRSRKCYSCGEKIAVGDDSLRLRRYKRAETDIEERIYGDEVPLAPYYFCETCGGLYFSITELGYCVVLDGTSMQHMALDVRDMQAK